MGIPMGISIPTVALVSELPIDLTCQAVTIVAEVKHPLQQRRKTSEQSDFFNVQSAAVSIIQHVKIGLDWFHNNRSQESKLMISIRYQLLLLRH